MEKKKKIKTRSSGNEGEAVPSGPAAAELPRTAAKRPAAGIPGGAVRAEDPPQPTGWALGQIRVAVQAFTAAGHQQPRPLTQTMSHAGPPAATPGRGWEGQALGRGEADPATRIGLG